MKKIQNFHDFLTDKLLEKMDLKIKELELVLSPKMIRILKQIKHKISERLLELHVATEPKFKMTFIDLGTKVGDVSYILSNKVPDLIEPDIVHGDYTRKIDGGEFQGGDFEFVPMYKNPWISDDEQMIDLFDDQFRSKEHPVWKKFRTETSALRFVKSIFGKDYPDNRKRGEISDLDVPDDYQSFQNMFTAIVESNSKILKLVDGEDIRRWYHCDNYFKNTGSLGGSCMKYGEKQPYFNIYVENKDKVQLLVLFPEEIRDKIIGRAIVWKLDTPDDRYFMDRIYVANDSDEYMFIEYAKKQGWFYKASQSIGYDSNIIDPKDESRKPRSFKIELLPKSHDRYPYMDTMCFYDRTSGLLTNDRDYAYKTNKNDGYFIKLSSDGGRYYTDI